MLHFYATTALKSFWPGGVLASVYAVRSEDMQEMTATAAKSLLIDNIPEVMCNLVGAQTAKHGATKVFNALQNATYNKQLVYVIFCVQFKLADHNAISIFVCPLMPHRNS